MTQIVTLVSSNPDRPVLPDHLHLVADCAEAHIDLVDWLAPGKAVDLYLPEPVGENAVKQLLQQVAADRIDCFFTSKGGSRRKKMLIADMDNTMVVGETLDDLADHLGLKEKIALITEQAMRGELDFKAALRERVAMLKGLSENALAETAHAIQLMPGAKELISFMRDQGVYCVLVSGGFTQFTDYVARQLGFQCNHGNNLEIAAGCLTGVVTEPIIDYLRKQYYLEKYAKDYNLPLELTLAVGDGANDLAMLSKAGLGVGFHPKPLLREKIVNCVLYGDLTSLIYAQGYRFPE